MPRTRAIFGRAVQDVLDGIGSGELRPLPVREVPFDRPGQAHRLLESGRSVGKLVLVR